MLPLVQLREQQIDLELLSVVVQYLSSTLSKGKASSAYYSSALHELQDDEAIKEIYDGVLDLSWVIFR